MAPVIRANSLYILVDGPSWTEAETNSVILGGHLVTINNEAENEWLRAIVPGDSISGFGGAWIGFSDENIEGQWVWSSGIHSEFTNWSPGQPGDDWGGQDYALMGRGGDWDDANPQPEYGSQHQASGIAEIPLQLSITRQGEVKEGSGVFATSINLSAGTQTSGNLAEGAQVWWKITGITADDLASGALSGTGTIQNGKLDIQHSLVIDADTGEQFQVSVFSDALMTTEYQIGTIGSVSVQEEPDWEVVYSTSVPGTVSNGVGSITLKADGTIAFSGSYTSDLTQGHLEKSEIA